MKNTINKVVWALLLCTALTNNLVAHPVEPEAEIEFVVEVLENNCPELHSVVDIADIIARIVLSDGKEVYLVEHIVERVQDDILKQKVINFFKALAKLKRSQRSITKIQALAMVYLGKSEAQQLNSHLTEKAIAAVAGNGMAGKIARAAAKVTPTPSINIDHLHDVLEQSSYYQR